VTGTLNLACQLAGESLPIPVRPAWSRDMSAEELELNEALAFEAWLRGIYALHSPEVSE
jgi:hypothetical protein